MMKDNFICTVTVLWIAFQFGCINCQGTAFLNDTTNVVSENDGRLEVCAQLTQPRGSAVTVNIKTSTLSLPSEAIATADEDFTPLNEDVTFEPGETQKCVSLVVHKDGIVENQQQEILRVVLSSSDVAISEPGTVLIKIEDSDNITVSFEQQEYLSTGESGSVTVCAIVTSGVLQRGVPFTVATQPGSASNQADYLQTSDMKTFTPVDNRLCISVFILDDNLVESNEFLLVSLSSENSAFAVNEDSGVTRVVIQDDDRAQIRVADDAVSSTNESDDGVVTLKLCISLTSNLALLRREVDVRLRTVPITAAPVEDYEDITNRVVTLSRDVHSVCEYVNVTGDTVRENDELFQVQISPSNSNDIVSPSSVTITILDNGDVEFPPNVGFMIDSSLYPSEPEAYYVYDSSHGSPSPLKVTCPLTVVSSATVIEWLLLDETSSSVSLDLSTCPCDVDDSHTLSVVSTNSSSSAVFSPDIPSTLNDVRLACFELTIEYRMTFFTSNPYLEILDIDSENRLVLPPGTTRFSISVLGLVTDRGGVTEVANREDYSLSVRDTNEGDELQQAFLLETNSYYLRMLSTDIPTNASNIIIFSLRLSRGDLSTAVLFTVIVNECPAERDTSFGIQWMSTPAGLIASQDCGLNTTGNATRLCHANTTWSQPDVRSCESKSFANVRTEVDALLQEGDQGVNLTTLSELLGLVSDLSELTASQESSLLPRDLETTSTILANTINLLDPELNAMEINQSLEIVTVFSNLLEMNNAPGIQFLQEEEEALNVPLSQDILSSLEDYGLYLISVLEQQESEVSKITWNTSNILLQAESVNSGNEMDFVVSINDTTVQIPSFFLTDRAQTGNSIVPVSNILIKNLVQYLPADLESLDTRPVSVILSTQVGTTSGSASEPVLFNFTVDSSQNEETICVFWNFSSHDGRGGWSTADVGRQGTTKVGNTTMVQCAANHLTSFAVLADSTVREIVDGLNYASFIGLSISLLFLSLALLSIVILICMKKTIEVEHFVHLNLVSALFLTYLVFAAGVDTANNNEGACKFIAALLHYSFLATFCWSLADGIMLLFLQWRAAKKLLSKWKWVFLIIGWFPPILFVIIGVATVLDVYGVKSSTDELQIQFCWLSYTAGSGDIWSLIVPMLTIILMSAVLISLVLIASAMFLKQHGQEPFTQAKVMSKERKKLILCALKSLAVLFLSVLILLFGTVLVNQNTNGVGWVFAIFTSAQGLLVFLFYGEELMTDKCWTSLKCTPDPPKIMAQSKSKSVVAGDEVTLEITASGKGTLTYQWKKNGEDITTDDFEGVTSPKLTVNVANSQHDGMYTCVVHNKGGKVESKEIDVTVVIRPEITDPLQSNSQTVVAGDNVTLEITASGKGTLTYQWKKNGEDITTDDFEGVTSPKLTVNAVNSQHEGMYTCVVSNEAGKVESKEIEVSVVAHPEIVTQSNSQTVVAGDKVTLEITASGKGTLTYQWKKNGEDITTDDFDGVTSPKLTLDAVNSQHEGMYTCVVSNEAGKVESKEIEVSVVAHPEIVTQSNSQTVVAGDKVTLEITASGKGTLTYQWKKNGEDITTDDFEGVTSPKLTVNAVNSQHEGMYTCVVSNEAGKVESEVIGVSVVAHPEIVTQSKSQTVVAGDEVTLVITASKKGTLTYQWKKNGEDITTDDFEGVTSPKLKINVANSQHDGMYTCVVRNEAGKVESKGIEVSVVVPPKIVTQSNSQTVVAGDKVNLEITASKKGTLTYQWKKNGEDITTDDFEGVTSPKLTLDAVNSQHEGMYTCVVSNEAGKVESKEIEVSVVAHPEIVTQSNSQTVVAGDKVTLEITASGKGTLTYQWKKNGEDITTDDFEGVTSPKLTVNAVNSQHEGMYTCVVSNEADKVESKEIEVSVVNPHYRDPDIESDYHLQINTHPKNVNIGEGKTVSFMVTAVGGDTLSYQWKRNGKDITGGTNATFQIDHAYQKDEGSYSCVVSNEVTSVESEEAKLVVGVCPDCNKRVYMHERKQFRNMDYHERCLLFCKDCRRTLSRVSYVQHYDSECPVLHGINRKEVPPRAPKTRITYAEVVKKS